MKSSKEQCADEIEVRYQRAQKMMPGINSRKLVRNDNLVPHWIDDTHCFWYECFSENVKQYRLVNCEELTNQLAFNHSALAIALRDSAKMDVNQDDLPITPLAMTITPRSVIFTAWNKRWRFDEASGRCQEVTVSTEKILAENEALSPDGKRIAFCRDNNLWLRDLDSGAERPVTADGEEFFSYASPPTYFGVVSGRGPSVQWSPDSQKMFVLQVDTRKVKSLPMIDYAPKNGNVRPSLSRVRVAYPGDKNIEEYNLSVIDIFGSQTFLKYPAIPATAADLGFFSSKLGWWSNDSRHGYFIHQERGDRVLYLVEFDSITGDCRVLFEEKSDTHISVKPEIMDSPLHVFLPDTEELIWWSERSGWGHLYLYDLKTGVLKNAISQGKWRVRDVLYVNAENRELLVQTGGRLPGRDPYLRDICLVNFDTGELRSLLSGDYDCFVHYKCADLMLQQTSDISKDVSGVSPSGEFIVVTLSRVDQVPISVLVNMSGHILLELEVADISGLPSAWQWPESVRFLAADGRTELYGVLFKPTDFDESKKYPVINLIVSGPRFAAVPHASFHNSRGYADRFYFLGVALAELGFIVVMIDSRGTPLRSKLFQDASYGWMPSSANTADHRIAIEQLAKRYSFIDLERVGIFAPTGYPGGLQNLFECPDFYKVGVINHHQDNRLICCSVEADKYHGLEGPIQGSCFPEELVDMWCGKLLLMHPMTSPFTPCYPPAATFRIVEALQKANKDFDLVMSPHVTEGVMGNYEMRRAWDFFVINLLGRECPKEFKLTGFSFH